MTSTGSEGHRILSKCPIAQVTILPPLQTNVALSPLLKTKEASCVASDSGFLTYSVFWGMEDSELSVYFGAGGSDICDCCLFLTATNPDQFNALRNLIGIDREVKITV